MLADVSNKAYTAAADNKPYIDSYSLKNHHDMTLSAIQIWIAQTVTETVQAVVKDLYTDDDFERDIRLSDDKR